MKIKKTLSRISQALDPVRQNIIVNQAFEIDRLQMQCIERDLYYKLWEPNDVY